MRLQNCTQTLQSLCEFYTVVTRKAGVDRAAAAELVEMWSAAMAVENATLQDLGDAMRAVREVCRFGTRWCGQPCDGSASRCLSPRTSRTGASSKGYVLSIPSRPTMRY